MHDVSCRVGALNSGAPFLVDVDGDRFTAAQEAVDHLATVDENVTRFLNVGNLESTVGPDDRAGVCCLSTRFRVHRSSVEHDILFGMLLVYF